MVSASMFAIAVFVVLKYVPSNPAAINLGGNANPIHHWQTTQTAFATCLILDFISWLWTVNRDKSRLFYLAVVINGLPVVTYTLLANGVTPILIDTYGRRLPIIRYLQWLFTTPSMLYLYSIISSVPDSDVVKSMVLGAGVILFGFVGGIAPQPFGIIFISMSFATFYFVLGSLNKMIVTAIEDTLLEDASYRGALRGARHFMTLTWAGIPLVWTISVLGLVSNNVEELLFSLLDFASKAGISCTILHSAIKTHAEKHDERLQAELQLERARTIEALEEAARTKASPPTACGAPRESAEGQGARGLHTSIRDLASSVLALVHACGPGEGAKKAANAGGIGACCCRPLLPPPIPTTSLAARAITPSSAANYQLAVLARARRWATESWDAQKALLRRCVLGAPHTARV